MHDLNINLQLILLLLFLLFNFFSYNRKIPLKAKIPKTKDYAPQFISYSVDTIRFNCDTFSLENLVQQIVFNYLHR